MNSIVLLGRTTSDIELKQTQGGKSVVSFTLAVKRPMAKDITDFFTITAWDKQAELLSRYVGKGEQICIRGCLTTRSWTDKQGNKRIATEVVANEVNFCESKNNPEANSSPNEQNGSQSKFGYVPQAYTGQTDSRFNFEEVKDDDLPF